MESSLAFKRWLTEGGDDTTWNASQIEVGVQLATARQKAMGLLMRHDPDAALDQSLSYAEYAALPLRIQALVEKPFSITAHLEVQIGCGDGFSETHYRLEHDDGTHLELSMPQDHRTGLTKSNLPVQGIELDGHGVIRGDTFQMVDDADASFVSREWPSGQADASIDFVTGKPIQGEGITAVAGGLVFHFQDIDSLQRINRVMAEADGRPGMKSGSSWLILAAAGGTLEQFPEQQFVEETTAAAYATTTGPKTALVIMVDFSDASGQPYNPTTLEQSIDVTISGGLARYSFNQTSMNATVNATTFRMPQPKTYYVGNTTTSTDDKHDDLHTHAVAAYTGAGNPDPFANYDTVCVVMTEIGFAWGGLASVGGQKMWLDTSNEEVILHEFGHNYGLDHAQYWVFNNSNGSSTNPVDSTGATEEYGDVFDVMGNGNLEDGHFGPGPKAFLGWLPSADWSILSNSTHNGTYRIYRFDHESSTGKRALRVTKSATSDYYWVGYRKDYSSIDDFAKGIYLTWDRASTGRNQSWLLDTTPGSTDGKADSAVTLGRTYTDTASAVHITPVAIGGTAPNEYIDVTVNFGSFPGNSAPTGTLVGPSSVNAREAVLFNVEAADANGDTLAYSWDMGDGMVKPNSTSIAHSWTQGGTYNISVTVSDMKGGTVTLQKNVTVTDPINTWTARTSGTTRNLYSIAANSTHAVIVGDRVILRSTDGSSWSNVTPGTGFTNAIIRDICWTGSEFIAVGQDSTGSGWEGVVWSSANGSTWSRIYETNVNGTELRHVASDASGTIVATAYASPIYRRDSSGSWTTVNMTIPNTKRINDVAYGDGVFALIAYNYSASVSPSYNGAAELWTSSNGLTWADKTSGTGLTGSNNWRDFRVIHHNGSDFIAGGWYSHICYSLDAATTWQTNETGDYYEPFSFAHGAGVNYAIAENSSNGFVNVDLISSDGQNWLVANPSAVSGRNKIGFFANTFITVGNSGQIRQSGVISPSYKYSDFATTYFPGGGSNALATSNPDNDWANNFIEYALGTNPNDANSKPLHTVFSINGSGDPVLDVTRVSRATGTAYSVWWSVDLKNWTRQGLTTTVDNSTLLKVVGDGVDTSGGRGFMRLQLDQP